jgi:DNA invertase Pin-like site-specific DNA recombinase
MDFVSGELGDLHPENWSTQNVRFLARSPMSKVLPMKRSKFTEEQIAFALRQAETGTRVGEVSRKMGISEQTFYRWKKKYGGLGAPN